MNLMKWYGVKRVYYSDHEGNICYIKLNQPNQEIEIHTSHGLRLMILRCRSQGTIGRQRLPLTKEQIKYLLETSIPKSI